MLQFVVLASCSWHGIAMVANNDNNDGQWYVPGKYATTQKDNFGYSFEMIIIIKYHQTNEHIPTYVPTYIHKMFS